MACWKLTTKKKDTNKIETFLSACLANNTQMTIDLLMSIYDILRFIY